MLSEKDSHVLVFLRKNGPTFGTDLLNAMHSKGILPVEGVLLLQSLLRAQLISSSGVGHVTGLRFSISDFGLEQLYLYEEDCNLKQEQRAKDKKDARRETIQTVFSGLALLISLASLLVSLHAII